MNPIEGPRDTSTAALLATALGSTRHPLAAWYAGLLGTAPPLRRFTAASAPTIRTKARRATTPDALRDLRCELAVAALLCADERDTLVYEPMRQQGRAGPDFLLRHHTGVDVYVEVSRLRPGGRGAQERLLSVLCGKLRQLVERAANLLVLVNDGAPLGAGDIQAVLGRLRERAAEKDDAFFAFRGLAGAAEFERRLPALAALLTAAPAQAAPGVCVPLHARYQLPPDLAGAMAAWDLAGLVGA